MTWTMASLRISGELAEAEAQKASLEPEMSRLEIREELCRKLIARAEGGDKQADADLRMLAIDFLEDVIAGRDDVAAPRALLRYVRDVLERSLPHDEDRLRARQIQIAAAVDLVLAETARHPGDAQPGQPHRGAPGIGVLAGRQGPRERRPRHERKQRPEGLGKPMACAGS